MAAKRVSNVTINNVNKFGKKLTLDQMLKAFKKKVEKSSLIKDLRSREYYLKPSEKRKLKKKAAALRMMREESKRYMKFSKNESDK